MESNAKVESPANPDIVPNHLNIRKYASCQKQKIAMFNVVLYRLAKFSYLRLTIKAPAPVVTPTSHCKTANLLCLNIGIDTEQEESVVVMT